MNGGGEGFNSSLVPLNLICFAVEKTPVNTFSPLIHGPHIQAHSLRLPNCLEGCRKDTPPRLQGTPDQP